MQSRNGVGDGLGTRLQRDQIWTHIIPQNGASILGDVKLLGGSVGGME